MEDAASNLVSAMGAQTISNLVSAREQAATEADSSIYQVFINHRGVDVKNTFASLLYHRLRGVHGHSVFLDEEELRAGDTFSPVIQGAIESASVHICIFSRHYAESAWCLNELCLILQSQHHRHTKIIPVFYDVEPSDLRRLNSGPYAKAFKDHQRQGRHIVAWRKALNEASEISGFVFKTRKSDHGDILERIVNDVTTEIVKWEPSEVSPHPVVGLEPAVDKLQSTIEEFCRQDIQGRKGPLIVGIVGVEGVGKSTLAKHFYNLKRLEFSRSCFLSEVSKSKDKLPSLQHKLLRDLLGYCDMHLDDTRQGRSILRDRLRGLRVLIVLDDVDQVEQINSLLDIDVTGRGSLIVITSRDKHLLNCFFPKTKTVLYEGEPLEGKHARELFCQHAFLQSKPYKGFEDLVNEFLKICGGLPLLLNILGAQLLGMPDRMCWKLLLEKLSRGLPDNILNILKVSYEDLNGEEKEMFLNIGCFFVGEERDLVVRVLEGLGYNNVWDCLESLRQRCMVEFHDDVPYLHEIECQLEQGYICNCDDLYRRPLKGRYKITMNSQVRELATHIAREDFRGLATRKPLRVSISNDIPRILDMQLQGGADFCRIPYWYWSSLPGCTPIKIKGVGDPSFVVPVDLSSSFGSWDMEGALVWLRLHNAMSNYFHDTISLGRLRVLEIQGHHGDLEQLFDRFIEPPSNMIELTINVTDTLIPSTSGSSRKFDLHDSSQQGDTTPSTSLFRFFKWIGTRMIRRINNLQQLAFDSERAGQGQTAPSTSLLRFVKWIGSSVKLVEKIVLKNIASITSLPIEFSELNNLRHIDLSGCTNLIELPKSFSKLVHLQYLSLRDCKKLSIPTDILGEICTLEYVNFKGCVQLVYLPTAIASQRSLRYLNLMRTCLLQLPVSLGRLYMLEQLRIGSPRLTELPDSVGDLMRLEELILIKCDGLKRILLEKIAAPRIKVLVIWGSPAVADFSFEDSGAMPVRMPVLTDFTLKNTSISRICFPEGVYASLQTVDLSGNFRLMQVIGLPSTLVRLSLQNCKKLKTLTNLSHMVNLKFLNINECVEMKTLNVEGLTSLEDIKAEACWKLRSIEGLSLLEQLNCVYISTDRRGIWNDIRLYLTFPLHRMLSTAIFSGMADENETRDERDIHSIMMQKFKLEVVDLVSDTTSFSSHVHIENFHSHGAILMCFISSPLSGRPFRVKFDADNSGGPAQEYRICRGNGQGKSLDVFMWRADSNLFTEYKEYSTMDVYCSQLLGSALDAEQVERGWMVLVDKNTNFVEICNEFLNVFASTNCGERMCADGQHSGVGAGEKASKAYG